MFGRRLRIPAADFQKPHCALLEWTWRFCDFAEVIPVYTGYNAQELLEFLQAITKKACIILKIKMEFIYYADNEYGSLKLIALYPQRK